jgi:DNA-directed RNA polymerase sigma subunit (sigma70/sigma32)
MTMPRAFSSEIDPKAAQAAIAYVNALSPDGQTRVLAGLMMDDRQVITMRRGWEGYQPMTDKAIAYVLHLPEAAVPGRYTAALGRLIARVRADMQARDAGGRRTTRPDGRARKASPYPAYLHGLNLRSQRVVSEYLGLGGLPPRTTREIADELGIIKATVSKVFYQALDRLRAQHEGRLPDDVQAALGRYMAKSGDLNRRPLPGRLNVEAGALDGLTDQARRVVTEYLGLGGERMRRQQEIADRLGVSQARVAWIYQDALHRMQARLGDALWVPEPAPCPVSRPVRRHVLPQELTLTEAMWATLDARESAILARLVGRDGQPILGQREIAAAMGISSARVSQLYRGAIEKLRATYGNAFWNGGAPVQR